MNAAAAPEAPMWFALPPEVHSTLLSTGAGPGPLLVAAEAWRALAAQYASAAIELTGLLGAVQAAAWQGPTAARFVAAHQPFVCWLRQAGMVASATATGYETAAAGYTSALAAMPTLVELAANHAVHGVLVATNFFGINTIPIALNEADYVRMWIQAAATMSVYQAVSGESLAATPTTSPAPQIVTTDATPAADSTFPDPTKLILQLFDEFLSTLRAMAFEYLPGPVGGLVSQVLDSFIAFASGEVFTILAYSVLDPLIYFGPFTPALSPFLSPIGLVGLAGIAGVDPASMSPAAGAHSPSPGQQGWPAVSEVATAGAGPATPAAAAGPLAPSAASAAPSVPAGAAPGFYAVGGDPGGEGFTPTSGTRAAAAVAAGSAAPAVANLAASERARATRKAKARQQVRKFRFEYLEDDARITPSDDPVTGAVAASESGSGTLGFTGTLSKSAAAQAKGLIRLDNGAFGEPTQEPMLPNTWDAGRKAE
ncbi:MAG TPA: PPE family protein [Mycobacterium sp.]|nr:PPE family protein [Mycobacterium sp.]